MQATTTQLKRFPINNSINREVIETKSKGAKGDQTMTTFDPAAISQSLSRAMTEAMRRGFQPPLQLICVGANGTLFAGQWVDTLKGGWAFESTVTYEKPDGLLHPVSIIVIDSASGKSFRLILR